MRGDSYQLQGQQGWKVIWGTGQIVGPFRWVQFLNDSVIADIDANYVDKDELLTITIPAGIGIGGVIASITLTSGAAIGYYE